MQQHIETVQRIYEAFGKGDIPTILEALTDQVEWDAWTKTSPDAASIPWLQSRQGKEDVTAFFSVLGTLIFHGFEVKNLLAGGQQVAAVIHLDVEVQATGVRVQDEEVHLWTFNDAGKVSAFRHVVDTAKHIRAAKGEAVQMA